MLKKDLWKRTQTFSHFQPHFKLIFQSVFNEVITIITLKTKACTDF